MTPFQEHKKKWGSCKRCKLHEQRRRVVLLRGEIPSPILFIGEAPGLSENALGKPFCGPAGKMLDRIISVAGISKSMYAITNLVGCIPRGEDKVQEPSDVYIRACEGRLNEVIWLCKPKLLVLLGKLAQKHVYGQAQFYGEKHTDSLPWLYGSCLEFLHLDHPAALLRLPVVQKGLAIQRAIEHLSDAVSTLNAVYFDL